MGSIEHGRVLLADDDGRLGLAVAANMRMRGWTMEVVSTGAAALERARASRPHIVLLDMRLPDVSGMTVLSAVRRLPDPPHVILISGYLDVKTTLEAMRCGAADVLEKPVEPAHLDRVMRALRAQPVPEVKVETDVPELVGSSPVMQRLREQVIKVAAFRELPILIMGDSGTGKELVARAIHRTGRASTQLVAINCAAMPETLFESELFGHASGSFTGAKGARAGLFEAAGHGSVFLDEVGEMPANLQAKLLRVLETRRYRRVGANEDLVLDARIISATNRRLRGAEGEALRPDLFFRLAGYTLMTPSLRSRLEDIEELAQHFLSTFKESYPTAPDRISPEAIEALRSHDWPGNVRELRAVLQSAIVRSDAGVIGVRQIAQALHSRGQWRTTPPPMVRPPAISETYDVVRDPSESRTRSREPSVLPEGLPEVERSLILKVADECDGNLSLAARRLKIPRSTLRDKLRRYGRR